MTTPNIPEKLAAFGVVLPETVPALYNYVPYVVAGNMVYIAGQVPVRAGQPVFVGKVGLDCSDADAISAAELCALNILAQVRDAVAGDWSRVKRCVRLGGFVNATPDYTAHSKIINGASDFLVNVMGDAGRHARAAVGVASLPLGVPVEVEAVFEIC